MIKRRLSALLALVLLPLSVHAADFVTVYRDAVECDPKFKAAQAEFQAIRRELPISIANFLPQVALQGRLASINQENTNNNIFEGDGKFHNEIVEYSLRVNQSVFNYANWALLGQADFTVKQAAANLCAAVQDLIIRTATAYFQVVNASEDLRFTRAEKASIKRELDQNTERYRVGLIAITAVYDAQASYDAVVAREVASMNAFADRIEELREITGKSYPTLMSVGKDFPLVRPTPANIEQWVCTAGRQNYTLEAARYASLVARENIKLQFSGHLPVVNGAANFDYNNQSDFLNNGFSKSKAVILELNGTLPIYNGGAVNAKTCQARFAYLQAVANEEAVRRNVVSRTRKAYMGVISGISQIHADKQAIVSRANELDATRAAYDVGTRTMVDVLNSQSKLYDTQRLFVRDQYIYLAQTLLLKQQAGTLTAEDVCQLNRWFKKPEKMISYNELGNIHIEAHSIPEQLSDKDLSKTPTPP
ncbi:MAG: TolC family outer membrane protein [Pseudomonadota bacterium]|nr:TolC family outer membrane protein [Pseudomonadota bacterium]